jgi:hypothetical protein
MIAFVRLAAVSFDMIDVTWNFTAHRPSCCDSPIFRPPAAAFSIPSCYSLAWISQSNSSICCTSAARCSIPCRISRRCVSEQRSHDSAHGTFCRALEHFFRFKNSVVLG